MPRVVTYNVRRCVGLDRGQAPERIARVLRACAADVIGLQEIDIVPGRFGNHLAVIAEALGMSAHFLPCIDLGIYQYGVALLTARPSRLVRAARLPRAGKLEPRGAIWAAVEIGGREVQVVTTHLGLGGRERLQQAEALLGPDWLGHPECREPRLLMGDLNATPVSRAYRRLAESPLRDAQTLLEGPPRCTFPNALPVLRIDHVWVGESIRVRAAHVPRDPLARVASDHLPLVVDFDLA
jgi:endonuclease/exonuclease/phosphatase family metal-dependent hydrolase